MDEEEVGRVGEGTVEVVIAVTYYDARLQTGMRCALESL